MNFFRSMTRYRVFLLGLITLLSLFAFTACSSDDDQTPSVEVTDQEASSEQSEETASEQSEETTTEQAEDMTEDETLTSDDTTEDESDVAAEESYYFEDLELKGLDGQMASLYDYEGQIILLNFWATWCKYCDEEMPLLNEINKREGISVIAIDVAEDADTVNAYLEKFGSDFNLDVYLDESSELASYFGITGYPTTFFIGPDFEYYYSYPGMLTEDYLDQILDAIDDYQSQK